MSTNNIYFHGEKIRKISILFGCKMCLVLSFENQGPMHLNINFQMKCVFS